MYKELFLWVIKDDIYKDIFLIVDYLFDLKIFCGKIE